MYPETDVPPVRLSPDYIEALRARLPETPEQTARRLVEEYGLNEKLAWQVVDEERVELFERAARETGVPATVIATTLTETLKSLRREGLDVEALSDEQLLELLEMVGRGELFKEAIPDVLRWLCENRGRSPREAAEALGLRPLSEEELRTVVEEVIASAPELVKKGRRAFGKLMGLVMKRVRGRADPAKVSALLEEALSSGAVRRGV